MPRSSVESLQAVLRCKMWSLPAAVGLVTTLVAVSTAQTPRKLRYLLNHTETIGDLGRGIINRSPVLRSQAQPALETWQRCRARETLAKGC